MNNDFVKQLIEATNKKELSEKDATFLITDYYQKNELEDSLNYAITCYKIAVFVNNDKLFSLSTDYIKKIHHYLFNGIIENAGNYRTINFSKREPCLHARSVIYSTFDMINDNLNYDLDREKRQVYRRTSMDQKVEMLSDFISHIWQAHPFSDGNTRTDMVFLQKYLDRLEIYHDNHIFDQNFTYFRNALVRSNYNNIGWIEPTYEYLNQFMYNYLTGNIKLLNVSETYVPEEKMIIKRR